MKRTPLILLLLLAGAVAACTWYWWPAESGVAKRAPSATQPVAARKALRLGLVPEHDVFALRRSYLDLTQYLERKLGRPVAVVTLSTYQAVLADFDEGQIDGAFLGSLVALLAMDRNGAQVLVKPEQMDGISTYCGVIFVRDDSSVKSLDDLGERSIGMLRATYAGSLFPVSELEKRGLVHGHRSPRIIWMGTHDEIIEAVASGRTDVGAVKDLRLDLYEKKNQGQKFRRLAVSKPVPNNALVLRGDVAAEIGPQIKLILLDMQTDPEGQRALASLGARRFVAARHEEYDPIFEMTGSLGSAWSLVGISGNPPKKPGTR